MKSHYDFSDTAMAELTVSFDQIEYMMKTTMNALRMGDTLLAKDVLEQEKEVNRMETRLRKQHMKRLNEKKCSPEFTVIFPFSFVIAAANSASLEFIATSGLGKVNLEWNG